MRFIKMPNKQKNQNLTRDMKGPAQSHKILLRKIKEFWLIDVPCSETKRDNLLNISVMYYLLHFGLFGNSSITFYILW